MLFSKSLVVILVSFIYTSESSKCDNACLPDGSGYLACIPIPTPGRLPFVLTSKCSIGSVCTCRGTPILQIRGNVPHGCDCISSVFPPPKTLIDSGYLEWTSNELFKDTVGEEIDVPFSETKEHIFETLKFPNGWYFQKETIWRSLFRLTRLEPIDDSKGTGFLRVSTIHGRTFSPPPLCKEEFVNSSNHLIPFYADKVAKVNKNLYEGEQKDDIGNRHYVAMVTKRDDNGFDIPTSVYSIKISKKVNRWSKEKNLETETSEEKIKIEYTSNDSIMKKKKAEFLKMLQDACQNAVNRRKN